MKKWLWITLGVIVGTHLIWYLYIVFHQFLFLWAGEGKDTIILDTIIFSVEVTVMCTVIILHKLNKLKK